MRHLVMLHIFWIAVMACFPVGCAEQRNIAKDFQSDDPKIRILAIRRAGREKLESTVSYLVDRLSDDEAEVRMFAIVALQEITGLTHGYRHYDSAVLRDEAIEKWRRWLMDKIVESAETQPVEERKTG